MCNRDTIYVSAKELANRFGVSLVTIWRWTKLGRLPAPIKFSPQCVRWPLNEIQRWERRQSEVDV